MADDDTVAATAQGLVHCLQMLTGEAASLNLIRTFKALEDALVVCQSEMARDRLDSAFDALSSGALRGNAFLH